MIVKTFKQSVREWIPPPANSTKFQSRQAKYLLTNYEIENIFYTENEI